MFAVTCNFHQKKACWHVIHHVSGHLAVASRLLPLTCDQSDAIKLPLIWQKVRHYDVQGTFTEVHQDQSILFRRPVFAFHPNITTPFSYLLFPLLPPSPVPPLLSSTYSSTISLPSPVFFSLNFLDRAAELLLSCNCGVRRSFLRCELETSDLLSMNSPGVSG